MNINFLIISSLAWFFFIGRSLLVSPLPRPVDVVALSLFFYNVPLSLLAMLPRDQFDLSIVFLNTVSSDPQVAKQVLILTLAATVALFGGRVLGVISQRTIQYEIATPVGTRLQWLSAAFCLCGLIMIVLGIFLFGLETFFAGYAVESTSALATGGTALIFFAYEVIGVCSFIWFFCKIRTRRSIGRTPVMLALAGIIIITLLRGKRLELVIALLPLFLMFWSTKIVKPLHRILISLSIVFAISSLASFRQGELPDTASIAFNTFSEGLYAGHVTPGVIEAVDQGGVSKENGLRFLAALAAFVPRFVFPAKDEVIYQSLVDISQFAPLGATSMLAEVYLQGGWWVVFGWFFCLGVVGGRLELSSLFGNESVLRIKTLLYLLFVCSFVPHFRDGIIPAIKIPMQLMLVITILLFTAFPRVKLIPKREVRCGLKIHS